MATVGNLDFQAFVDDKKAGRAGVRGSDDRDPHSYAYVSDKHTRFAFEKLKPVELAVSATVRLLKQVGVTELLGTSVKVGPKQFPRVYELGVRCAEDLGIAVPTIYIRNNPVLNAMTYGTNDDAFILVHSALVDHFSDEELLSVIGHECGHIHNDHVVYLTAMYYLRVMASAFMGRIVAPAPLALTSWTRRAEITCDRAGMLCSKSLDISTRALAKLALGSVKLYDELDMEVYLEQYEEGQQSVGKLTEVVATHPWLPKRVKALRLFADSAMFRKQLGKEGGLSMEEVDEKVRQVVKVLG